MQLRRDGLALLRSHFEQNDPYPITKDTRLAYACRRHTQAGNPPPYIIDPTGFSIQQYGGQEVGPRCDGLVVAV